MVRIQEALEIQEMCTYTKWPRAWAAICSKLYIVNFIHFLVISIELHQFVSIHTITVASFPGSSGGESNSF